MIGNDWDILLKDEFNKDYFKNLEEFVLNEYNTKTIYPPFGDIFNAFKLTPFSEVKVVILGQDPYHEKGQAHGLALPPGGLSKGYVHDARHFKMEMTFVRNR